MIQKSDIVESYVNVKQPSKRYTCIHIKNKARQELALKIADEISETFDKMDDCEFMIEAHKIIVQDMHKLMQTLRSSSQGEKEE